MLHQKDYVELITIAEKATEYLHEKTIYTFWLYGIYWDDSEHKWIVSFYIDDGDNPFINVWVSGITTVRYTLSGHSFNKPSFDGFL